MLNKLKAAALSLALAMPAAQATAQTETQAGCIYCCKVTIVCGVRLT